MKEHEIISVLPNSIAEEIEIEAGDCLIAIDGLPVCDYFDYLFYTSMDEFTLHIRKKDGEIVLYDVEKYEDENLGLVFADDLMDRQRNCANKCVFCFIDQMPPNMRDTLYFKDDDWRLSVLTGNYITLTNTSEKELDRIIRLRVSPLYISVHSTIPEIRTEMMGNKNAGKIKEILKKLFENQISFHCQIVLCPGYNDGESLNQTCRELAEFYPYCRSIAIVPVGMTKFRENLAPIKPLDKEGARTIISQVSTLQQEFQSKFSDALIYLSDEMYIKAQLPLPDYESYGEFEQIENGVGLVRKFEFEFNSALEEMPTALNRHITLCTGASAYDFITELAGRAMAHTNGLKIDVVMVKNNYFGETITVAGLLTGSDIIMGLEGKTLGEFVLIPGSMLKYKTDVFLDDVSVGQLSDKLGKPVIPSGHSGRELVDAIYGKTGACFN